MGYFSNVKRVAHKVTVEGNDFHIRSMTTKEIRSLPDIADPDHVFNSFKVALCNENGEPCLTDDDKESFFDLPQSVVTGLLNALGDLHQQKKS